MATPGAGPRRFVAAGHFGTGEVEWCAQPDDEPHEVAAAVLHHLLINRLREQHRVSLSSASFRVLTGGSDRTALRLLNGESAASLADLISWPAAAGPDLLDGVPLEVQSLLPAGAPPLAAGWQPGQRRRPTFASRPGTSIDWGEVAQRIGFIEAEDAAARARLLGHAVVRHMILTAITETGVAAGLASVDAAIEDGQGTFDLVFDMGTEVEVVSVGSHLTGTDRGELLQSTADFVQALHRTSVANADRRNHVAVMSVALYDRLVALAPDLRGEPDTRFTLSFRSTRTLLPTGSEPRDICGVILTGTAAEPWALLALALEKPQPSDGS